jgi:hypothetical protein
VGRVEVAPGVKPGFPRPPSSSPPPPLFLFLFVLQSWGVFLRCLFVCFFSLTSHVRVDYPLFCCFVFSLASGIPIPPSPFFPAVALTPSQCITPRHLIAAALSIKYFFCFVFISAFFFYVRCFLCWRVGLESRSKRVVPPFCANAPQNRSRGETKIQQRIWAIGLTSFSFCCCFVSFRKFCMSVMRHFVDEVREVREREKTQQAGKRMKRGGDAAAAFTTHAAVRGGKPGPACSCPRPLPPPSSLSSPCRPHPWNAKREAETPRQTRTPQPLAPTPHFFFSRRWAHPKPPIPATSAAPSRPPTPPDELSKERE